jgi:hypothetical protein
MSSEQGDEGKRAEGQPGFDTAQLQAILNGLPAYAWYAAPSGGLCIKFRAGHAAAGPRLGRMYAGRSPTLLK